MYLELGKLGIYVGRHYWELSRVGFSKCARQVNLWIGPWMLTVSSKRPLTAEEYRALWGDDEYCETAWLNGAEWGADETAWLNGAEWGSGAAAAAQGGEAQHSHDARPEIVAARPVAVHA